MALNYDSPLIDNTAGSPTLDSLKSGSDKINGALTEIKEEVNDLGSASLVDTGTAAGEVPTNADLGSASTADVQTSATDITADRLMKVGAFGVGYDPSDGVFSYNQWPNTSLLDVSGVAAGAHYSVFNLTNTPESGVDGTVYFFAQSSIRRELIFYDRASPKIWFTQSVDSGSTWTDWVELYHTGNTGTAATKDTGTAAGEVPLNSTLVPKSGGTFTGDITYYGGGGVSTNTSYGTQSLSSNTTGFNNTAHGSYALYSNTAGVFNVATGSNALRNNTTGSNNTATGYNALRFNTTGYSNTANGYQSLYSNTTGDNNTATGFQALYSNTSGYYNTASGYQALYYNTIGDYNTASGYLALYGNTTGDRNTATGYNALSSNTTGGENVATGHLALGSNTTGGSNTAHGSYALLYNTTGNYNTATGYRALYNNTTGIFNVATGHSAMYSNTEGSYNTAHGNNALLSNTTGDYNTAYGSIALYFNTTGDNNTACGYRALLSNTTYNNTAGFGHDAQVTGSNQIQLGDSDTTTYVYGTVQNRSDLRDKADVRGTVLGLGFITSLRPVDYRWDMREDYETDTPDGTHKRGRYHHGFIAQEIAEVIEESGVDFGGYQDHKVAGGEDVLSLGYDELIGPLVKALQELNQKFDDYVKTHP